MEKSSRKVGYYLERTTRIVKLKFTQKFKELNVDLTPEQWVILDNLSEANGLSQTEIAKLTYKNTPTVSRIIDLLEKKALVERRKEGADRRIYKIFLTERGSKMVEMLRPEIDAIRTQTWNGLNEDDYNEFLRIINQVFSNLELD